jgi:integrase
LLIYVVPRGATGLSTPTADPRVIHRSSQRVAARGPGVQRRKPHPTSHGGQPISTRQREPIRQVRLSDGSLRYEVTVDVGRDSTGRRRQSRTRYRTLREAKVALAKTRLGVHEGTHVVRDVLTLRTYLARWADGKIDLRSSTRDGYRVALKPVLDRWGDLPVQQLTKAHLDELVTEQLASGGLSGGGRSARTVTLMLVVLGQALDAAARERLVTANVASLVNRPASAPVVVKKTWTADQVRTFLTYVADDRLAAAWRLTMLGLRRGEVLGLRWSDVDFESRSASIARARVPEGGRIVVNKPKTARGVRTIYLPAEVVSDLVRLRAVQHDEQRAIGAGFTAADEWILVDPIGRPYRPEWYGKEFRRLSAEAGLPRIRLHDARHTAASLLAQGGVEIGVAAALLGHDPVVYLQTYVHPYEDAKRAASEQLAAAYR